MEGSYQEPAAHASASSPPGDLVDSDPSGILGQVVKLADTQP